MYTIELSEPAKQLTMCCGDVADIDDKLRSLKRMAKRIDGDSVVLRSSWKTDADAIRSTKSIDTKLIRLEKLEAIQADINDLTVKKERIKHEAALLYRQVNDDEKEAAAIILRNYCGICEPFDILHHEGRI